MGFAFYKFKRSKDGVELGTINLICPKVNEPISVGSSFSNKILIEQLVTNYPDFPVEANVFTHAKNIELAKNMGFGNVLNCDEYAGETWTLDNGAKITFDELSSSGGMNYKFYYPDGSVWVDGGITGDSAYLGWPPFILGEDEEGALPQTLIDLDPLKRGRIYLPAQVPVSNTVHIFNFYAGATPIYTTNDPFGDGGISEPGGGSGDFDGTGDDIEIPSLPTLSAVDAGFITLFNPTLGELNSLSSYMWSDLFDVNGWKKVFADPMQAILGLSIVPVNVPASDGKPVKVGNISTGVSMTVAASQYVEVDCGTLNVNEFWGAYLDYDPYTKAEIYLPYIGTHPLSTDDIMNKPVHVVYHVDILSGACCAYVKCGGSVLYSFIGQCASSIPITGDNWTNVINGAINIAGAIGSMVATGGASAPMAIGQIASTAVNQMKPSVEKSGAMGGTGGMLGVQTPYLILTRPRQALPRDQNAFIGYPSFITENLGSLSGYTEIDSIHLENVPATEPELSEIESLLKSGVIF